MKKETINLIAENLKTLRTFKTLSQDEIAEQIGCCRSIYAHYERATRVPDAETLFAIANKFGIEMSAFFEPDHETFVNILASSAALSKNEKRLLGLYNRMSPYHKGSLMERAIVLVELEDDELK